MTDKERKRRLRLRSTVRSKVASSTAAGTAVLAISSLTKQDFIEGLLLSILVGGIVLLTEILSDFDAQLRSVNEQQQAERLSNTATRLHEKVAASPVDGEQVDYLLDQIGQLPPQTPRLLTDLFNRRLKDLGTFAKQVHEAKRYGGPGQSAAEQPFSITYHGEDREWLLDLTSLTTKSMDAISLSTIDAGVQDYDGGLWTSDLGHRYVELMRWATMREVQIRRLFFFDLPGIPEDAVFREICLTQKAIGVEVRILAEESLRPHLRSMVSDFIVFDAEVGYEMSSDVALPDGHKPQRMRTTLTYEPERVQDLQRKFEQLWELAHRPSWIYDHPQLPAQAGSERPDPEKT
jgi:hypothetical protein